MNEGIEKSVPRTQKQLKLSTTIAPFFAVPPIDAVLSKLLNCHHEIRMKPETLF